MVDLQVISDSPILLQAARLQATERNGGRRSDVYQILEGSCEKVDSLSRSARSTECRWLIMQSSVGAACTKTKGLHRLGKYCCKADVNWQ